ncbi:YidC/Oxa1 family insertase periplasmic-domain containing protein [Candidatus Marinimicrobia bacterium]|nr:YidC/Oxa1 family insertase periplasmic-domain containing protein [Candidatus Neomarinimicrobiota bacterium]
MTDTKRTIAAGLVIGLLTLVIPFYLQLIGVVPGEASNQDPTVSSDSLQNSLVQEKDPAPVVFQEATRDKKTTKTEIINFSVITDKYHALVSNMGGGSVVNFEMHSFEGDAYKYIGGYDELGNYSKEVGLNLTIPKENPCSPCLRTSSEDFFNVPFEVISPSLYSGQTISLQKEDSLVIVMQGSLDNQSVTKKLVLYGNKYIINHDYSLVNAPNNVSLVWADGIKTTEKNLFEELTYSSGYVAQSKEINSLSFSPESASEIKSAVSYGGKTDWVAIRNKYFINALISSESTGGTLAASAYQLNEESLIPVYEMGLNFSSPSISVSQFFGPLDVDIIESSNTYLDRVMNFGWLPIQPFSRSVLWLLKKLHLLGINYGVILILFAFLIRIITGPLTKKSFESTQKMQKIQPRLKKIQEKHKNDSQKLNKEMVSLYKETGVNPLGGCLPMLIQMPLLFSLFIVFRSTIEFRGAPFFGWINNLSQPDTIFDLSFTIPLYGNQVAFLPFVLGISMFLTQRLSMATMDKNTKPMMYMMTGFFFILFNSFPSGLNLYYTVYNFLNYFQQKSIKGK